ncbi:MAG: hypothetical protein A2W80_07160 [Candidatus Riflebacteria bacterium GWC2_50_8]|nr:MAG: hypothetical protein A2W80_07160 [Candidatus Riflebacteria bacterium GWC2_50_8]
MDYLTLKKHVTELAGQLSDRPLLARAVDSGGRSFSLRLKRKSGDWADLVVNLDSPDQGLRLTENVVELDRNSSLVRTINRLLVDSRLLSVELAGSEAEGRFDRVVSLHFVVIDSFFGNRSDYYLFCELTGRIADVFICDADHKILDRLSRTSNNLIGAIYRLPESMPLHNPFTTAPESLNRIFAAPAEEWKNHIGALSPILQAELSFRLKTCSSQNPAETFCALLAEVLADQQAYVYCRDGKLKAISGYRLEHLQSLSLQVFPQINDAANWVGCNIVLPRRLADQKKRCVDMLAREVRQKQQLLEDQHNLLTKYSESEHYRHHGDLLVANLYQIKQGSRFAEVEDWHTSALVRIELDPAKTPAAVAQRYFNLYKKSQRGIAEVEKRLKILGDELAWLREQLWLAETAEQEADLLPDLIKSAAESDRHPNHKGGKKASKKEDKSPRGGRKRVDFKPVVEIDGCRFYAGRNARQNDALTFQLARRGDYWFHANDVPGAHVILRKAEGEVSETDLHRGAQLAAWFSFARNSSKVPVDCADVAHVKRIPGGGPGRVSYTHQKTLLADPSAAAAMLSESIKTT